MKRMKNKYTYSVMKAGENARAEHRKTVIEYYQTTANFSKSATARHFAQLGYSGNTVYTIIRRFNDRGTTAHISQGLLARLEKYEELLRRDPTISSTEAAAILKTSVSAIKRVREVRLKRQQAKFGVEKKGGALGSPVGVNNCDSNGSNLSETEIEPEPIPSILAKAKEIPTNFYCFACAETFQEAENSAGVSKNGELKENLTVIFALRTLLDLSSEEVVNLLREAKGKNPGEWISFCNKCHDLVSDGLEIQNQIQGLQKKLGDCKLNLRKKIINSRHQTTKKKGVNSEPKQVAKIEEMVRKRIRNSEPRRPVNPFIEGDKEAERKCLAMTQVQDSDLPEFELPLPEWEQCGVAPESNLNAYQPDAGTIGDSSHNTSIVVKYEVEVAEERSDGDDSYPPEFEYQPYHDPTPSSVATTSTNSAGNDAVPLPVQYVCEFCGDSVRSSILPLHKLREHGVLMEGFTEFRCDKEGCKYVTIYKTNYTYHAEKHDPNRKRYFCQFCSKVYVRSEDLKSHEELHRVGDSKPFQCGSCGKSFARKYKVHLASLAKIKVTAKLKNHIKRVHEKRPYISHVISN